MAVLNRIRVEKGAINIPFVSYPEYGSACQISRNEAT
jgi:hypothetical protein